MARNLLKSSSIKDIDTAFLKNRGLLYIIFLLALGNVYYMMAENNITFLMIFIIIGFLTSFFSKNMVVILSIAMTFTYILRYGANIYKLEGYEGKEKKEGFEGESMDEEDEDENENKMPMTENMDSSGNYMKSESSKMSSTITPASEIKFDFSSVLPTISENMNMQKQILEKLSGIEKFTNGLNEYIN